MKRINFYLSATIFLQFFAMGTVTPIIGLYLKDYLGFTGSQIGIILATSSVSAIISPLLGTFIADRVIAAEKLYSMCHFFASIIMLCLSSISSFLPFFLLFFLYTILFGPTVPLSNTLIFHHTADRKKNYGSIRLWGTIGWMAAGILFSTIWLKTGGSTTTGSRLPDFLKLAFIISLLLSIFSFFIPESGAKEKNRNRIIPVDAVKVLMKPEIAMISAFAFVMFFFLQYYNYWMSPFLKAAGFEESAIMPVLTLGQVSEIFAMMALGFILKKWGFKKVFITGCVFELIRYSMLISGNPAAISAGIFCHGFAYTFIFANIFIFLDSRCTAKDRAGVMLLYGIITAGFAKLAGSITAGLLTEHITLNGEVNYRIFWGLPLLVIFITVIIFYFAFPGKNSENGSS